MNVRDIPIVSLMLSEWQVWREEREQPTYNLALLPLDASELPAYPINMWPSLMVPHGTLDDVGVPYNRSTKKYPAAYHPTTIAQYALANWNAYLTTRNEKHKKAFMIQAHWLVAHESRLIDDMGGWPIPFPEPDYNAPPSWLSAMTQGEGISILIRAYRLTGEDIFLQVAHRAIRTFGRDIRDGGVTTAIGDNGIFFEEVAVYPTTHILNGFLFALFGLYDYAALTEDAGVKELIQCSHTTLHTLFDKFDTGYWTHYDLLSERMATLFYHSLHILQLKVIARYMSCKHCETAAERWEAYQRSCMSHLHYFLVRFVIRFRRGFRRILMHKLSKKWNQARFILHFDR
jgi:D-glucuronyl C5-epimerase C-terminus